MTGEVGPRVGEWRSLTGGGEPVRGPPEVTSVSPGNPRPLGLVPCEVDLNLALSGPPTVGVSRTPLESRPLASTADDGLSTTRTRDGSCPVGLARSRLYCRSSYKDSPRRTGSSIRLRTGSGFFGDGKSRSTLPRPPSRLPHPGCRRSEGGLGGRRWSVVQSPGVHTHGPSTGSRLDGPVGRAQGGDGPTSTLPVGPSDSVGRKRESTPPWLGGPVPSPAPPAPGVSAVPGTAADPDPAREADKAVVTEEDAEGVPAVTEEVPRVCPQTLADVAVSDLEEVGRPVRDALSTPTGVWPGGQAPRRPPRTTRAHRPESLSRKADEGSLGTSLREPRS